MPPKAKAGKKGGKKAGKKLTKISEDPETRYYFESKIRDLNHVLAKLRTSLSENLKKKEALEAEERADVDDGADVVAFLERCLREQEDEFKLLQAQEEQFQKEEDNVNADNSEVINAKEEEFQQMVEELKSQIKLLTGKISSLEEFRLQRDEMMKRFEEQENFVEEQRVRHKRVLYEKEKEYIVSKDLLEKEMEAKLLKLCNDFQDATDFRVAAKSRELLTQNIDVNNQLTILMQEGRNLQLSNEILRKKDKKLRIEHSFKRYTKDKAIKIVQNQTAEIQALTRQYREFRENFENFQAIVVENEEYVKELKELEDAIGELEVKLRILEQNIHNFRCKRLELIPDLNAENEEVRWLRGKLDALRLQVKEQFRSSEICEEESGEEDEGKILYDLVATLLDIQTHQTRPLPETASKSCSAIYMEGPQGLVPKKIAAKEEEFVPCTVETQTSSVYLSSSAQEEVGVDFWTKKEEEENDDFEEESFVCEDGEYEMDEYKEEEEEQVYFSGELSESEEDEGP